MSTWRKLRLIMMKQVFWKADADSSIYINSMTQHLTISVLANKLHNLHSANGTATSLITGQIVSSDVPRLHVTASWSASAVCWLRRSLRSIWWFPIAQLQPKPEMEPPIFWQNVRLIKSLIEWPKAKSIESPNKWARARLILWSSDQLQDCDRGCPLGCSICI